MKFFQNLCECIVIGAIVGWLMLLLCRPAKAAYFETIFSDPLHPRISATLLYTPQFKPDGGVANVAIIHHRASSQDTIIPKMLLNLGMQPVSWTLLELGGGGNREKGFGTIGTSVDLAPTLLGPLASWLLKVGGKGAAVSQLLVSPDGTGGVKLSIAWKADALEHGTIMPLNHWRFPPRYGVGYCYQF